MNQRVACLVAVGLFALPAFSFGDEQEMSLADAPAAVQAAVKKTVGEHKIDGFSKEVEDGKTTFEAEFDVEGVGHSVTLADDGKVMEEETQVEPADLPKAVRKAVKKAEPHGKVKEAAKVTAGGKTYYEVDLMVGEVKHEVKVEAEGKLISNKIEKAEADEKEADEHDEKDEKGEMDEHDEHDEPAEHAKAGEHAENGDHAEKDEHGQHGEHGEHEDKD